MTILEPALPIIDAHHHLRDTPVIRYLVEDLLADLATGHNIVATVFIEGGTQYRSDGPELFKPVGETAFAARAAGTAKAAGGPLACAGIVATGDLCDAAAGDLLRAHIDAGAGRFRGIRMVTCFDRDIRPAHRPVTEGVVATPAFRRGLRELGRLGLSYDAIVYHSQLDELADTARAVPDVPIILNHYGLPLLTGHYAGQRSAVEAAWRAGMTRLARCPNVYVKLGGLGVAAVGYNYRQRTPPPTADEIARDWAPWFDHTLALFGTQRCMFESNFPVDMTIGSYPAVWNAFKAQARRLSAAEKADLFYETARKVYRLDVPACPA